ncbi:MAG: mannosyl transferase [Mucilaginibacter sp.]|nr:mannosyl transferase [Mucilaginibacter sp.]
MEIIFFTHPGFLGSQSMPRFANMLSDGMQKRGHTVQIWYPQPNFFKLFKNGSLSKWFGYIDQFVVFPLQVKRRLKSCNKNTLFVFTDHALGPWVPLVSNRAHVIHCHDFLAQRSAIKKIKLNETSFTGRLYQKFIWKGYSKGENFISVSNKTNEDLQQFLIAKPKLCEVVYNGLNRSFNNLNPIEARTLFGKATGLDLDKEGYILHIGGNQWYKNRKGVIEIYDSWRRISNKRLPLLLIGKSATPELSKKRESSKYADDIFFLNDVADEQLQLAYSGACLLLFPSLAEGFGWPIAEAMASGCPVITTDQAPMTEVASDAAFLIPQRPETPEEVIAWANEAALIVNQVVNLSPVQLKAIVKAGITNSKRFETNIALDKIENIYKTIQKNYLNQI